MLVSWKQWLSRTRHSALIWQFRNTDTFRFVQALEEERGRKTVVHRYLFSNYAFEMAINKHLPKNGDWTSVLNLSFGLQMDVVVHWESQDPKHCLPCHLKLLRVSPPCLQLPWLHPALGNWSLLGIKNVREVCLWAAELKFICWQQFVNTCPVDSAAMGSWSFWSFFLDFVFQLVFVLSYLLICPDLYYRFKYELTSM